MGLPPWTLTCPPKRDHSQKQISPSNHYFSGGIQIQIIQQNNTHPKYPKIIQPFICLHWSYEFLGFNNRFIQKQHRGILHAEMVVTIIGKFVMNLVIFFFSNPGMLWFENGVLLGSRDFQWSFFQLTTGISDREIFVESAPPRCPYWTTLETPGNMKVTCLFWQGFFDGFWGEVETWLG